MRDHRPHGGDPWGAVAQEAQQVEPDAFDESEPVPATTVTLVEGACFAICGLGGDVDGGVEGLFVGDTRICSRIVVSVDGSPVEPATASCGSSGWSWGSRGRSGPTAPQRS